MRCPICDSTDTCVIKGFHTIAPDGDALYYRRHECKACKERFSTYQGYERPDTTAETRLAAVLKDLIAMEATIKIHIKQSA